MKWNHVHCRLFLIILGSLLLISTAQNSILYPFGLDERDSSLPRDRDDTSSPEIRLSVPIVFYGQKYTSLYVNQNGLISFLIEVPTFVNIQFPLDYPSIASLYSDVDTRIAGSIYYRETQVGILLDRARTFLASHFSSASEFRPSSLFIVTWNEVGSFNRKSDKTNTFQLVIGSDGEESYAIFNYGNIEWIQGTGKNPSMPDAKAQAGFISGSGPHYSLKGSGTDQVSSLHKRSNVGQRGVWAFKIGQINEIPQEPDLTAENGTHESSTSCASGGTSSCHSRAICVDYSPGFCCQCAVGYYGNGKTCFENGIPERAVGKVRGVLNGIAVNDADLYSYVTPADGRAFTAINKITDRLGYDFQALSVIGAIFGWLFSVQLKGAPNGFQLTGGVLNYTAEVSFVQTGHKVTITQTYSGLDVFNQLKVETRIHGTTSVVPVGTKIEVNDFDILLTRVSPGLIRSKSSHKYRIEGTSADNPFTIEQTIAYEECPWASPLPPELQTTKMKVGKSYIDYDAEQEIIRYAITSTTAPPDGEDPCKQDGTEKCRQLSSCVADGNSYKCICNLGYEEEYIEGNEGQGPHCVDINECTSGTSDCDVAAHCINIEGSYLCNCSESYVGDGRTCSKALTCADVQCGTNAQCVEAKLGEPQCECVAGYVGDGLLCMPKTSDHGENENQHPCSLCDRNAECIFDPIINDYSCKCSERYRGNGTSCTLQEESQSQHPCSYCDRNAECFVDPILNDYNCKCRDGYQGNGSSCTALESQNQHPCSTCDRNAECFVDPILNDYNCKCRDGYQGNGSSCLPLESQNQHPCSACDRNAECFFDTTINDYNCKCTERYHGNGISCTLQEESQNPHPCSSCDRNSECIFDPIAYDYTCKCSEGYYGNGTTCTLQQESRPEPDTSDCLDIELCHPYADCLPISNRDTLAHHCVCRHPFVGDGYKDCKDTRTHPEDPQTAIPLPECTFGDRCWCPPEYEFDDAHYKCVLKKTGETKTCDVDPSICDLNARCITKAEVGTECVCNTGFHGNGRECLPQDLCAGHADCGAYEECQYNRTELRFRCTCKDGFLRNVAGDRCEAGPNVGCDILNNCEINGRCVWEPHLSKFKCECKPGFLGDGFRCQEDMTGCNVLNNCARNAECSFNTETKRFQCNCRQGFQGDGKQCTSSTPCYKDPTVCDINAECQPNPEKREWACHCKAGFVGDGFDCHEAKKREIQFLLVAKGMSLIKVPLNGERSHPVVIDPLQTSIGIDIDCPSERIYWSDVGGKMIKSAYFNGSDKTSFLHQEIGSPEGLSIDWASQNLYWTDSSKDTIEVANLITKKRKTLIFTELVNPRGIAVYPQRGRLFWTDWNRDRPKIEFSGLDGIGRQILVGEGLSLPNSIVIDISSDQICFADAGTHKIECVGIDGRGRRTFVSGIKYPFGLAIGSDTFYWSDWNTTFIERATRRNGVIGQNIDVSLGGPGKLYGIVLVPQMCPRVFSSCNADSCPGDDFICLPNMRGGHTCRCSDLATINCKEIL